MKNKNRKQTNNISEENRKYTHKNNQKIKKK